MFPAARTATSAVRRSTRFVTWVRSWRAGLVPYDEVAAEIAEDEEHLAADAPGTWTEVPLGDVLSMFAKLHPDEVRVVLPVPGDPRGLPGPGAFTGAAPLAGQSAPGGAVTGYEAQRRDEALRPLTTACRRAMAAACNAPLI